MTSTDPLLDQLATLDAEAGNPQAAVESPAAQALLERILAEPRPASTGPGRTQTSTTVRRPVSWPRRVAVLAVGLAVAGVGTTLLRPAGDVAAVAGGVTNLAVQAPGCTVRNATAEEAASAAYLLESPRLPLFRFDAVRVSGCEPDAWPAASYLRVDPSTSEVTGALSVWTGDEAASHVPVDSTMSQVPLGSTTATLTDAGDGLLVLSWESSSTWWHVTASGVDASTVLELAEAVATTGSTRELPQSVDGLDEVTLPAPPGGPAVLVDLSYTAQAEDESTGDAVFLTVRPTVPWQAALSTGYALGRGGAFLVAVGASSGLAVDNGGPGSPSVTLTWDLPSGQTARLWGEGDVDAFVAAAQGLEQVGPDDASLTGVLNARDAFRGR